MRPDSSPAPSSADAESRPDASSAADPTASLDGGVVVAPDFAGIGNVDYIDGLYRQYLNNPTSVEESWRAFFAGFQFAGTGRSAGETGDVQIVPEAVRVPAVTGEGTDTLPAAGRIEAHEAFHGVTHGVEVPRVVGVYDLVHTYREFGHFEANLDPLGHSRGEHPMLHLENFGLEEQSENLQVGNGGFCGPVDGTLGDLVNKLRETYCQSVGVEFTGISDKQQRDWLQAEMEPVLNRPEVSTARKKHILRQLIAAEEFEQYLGRAFVGAKRFSIEGAESLVPLLNTIVEYGAHLEGDQFICAMAHRGRLNVLAHVLEKPYEVLLAEFAGTITRDPDVHGDGDVKYHLGYANLRNVSEDGQSDPKPAKVSMLPNPSHLELINPIQQGIIRCKQDWLLDGDRTRVVPVCMHGDAAFTGQGIVSETLNLSEMSGYRTGGTIHIIINNQIGFTTSPGQGRFTPYPSDNAKAIQAPVFHVNGDDPEAVAHVAKVAIAYRQQFKQDVIIDLWCYRRHGHNEQDEPSFTQPLMYREIAQHPSVRALYERRLLEEGVVTQDELDAMKAEVLDKLKAAREEATVEKPRGKVPSFGGVWKGFGRSPRDYREWTAETTVDRETLRSVVASLEKLPEGFRVHPKLRKLLESRVQAVESGEGIDYGLGEMLALGSLLLEGTSVRFTGQDVERGTFSHRHATLYDYETGEPYRPLKHVAAAAGRKSQGRFEIRNTMLSELATVGFEWGFASADPRNLVIWEAQFGDFVNGAQALIDQIIAAAESKWRYQNGLVLNLPHGYEGQGPEHSNAYLERFLSLCAEGNMQVAVPSTPAQYFHLLRRQIIRKFRKPLILMMPKSLLRKAEATSTIEEFIDRGLQLVIDDTQADADKVRRVLLCSGKVFYTLDAARQKRKVDNVAIVRVEQLYPLPEHELLEVLKRYPKATEVFWTQEEPQNRGAWGYMHPILREMLPDVIVDYRGRDRAASPATGSPKMHALEEQEFVGDALEVSKSATVAGAV